eukprot:scaffold310720_cov36-Tisochrysis_lutea.AAC.5
MIRRVGDHEAYSALRASELGDGAASRMVITVSHAHPSGTPRAPSWPVCPHSRGATDALRRYSRASRSPKSYGIHRKDGSGTRSPSHDESVCAICIFYAGAPLAILLRASSSRHAYRLCLHSSTSHGACFDGAAGKLHLLPPFACAAAPRAAGALSSHRCIISNKKSGFYDGCKNAVALATRLAIGK